MKKIFDYYYLVLLRHYDNWHRKDRLSYHVPHIISLTLTANLISLAILFDNHIIQYGWGLSLGFVVVGISLMFVFEAIYDKERRQKLRKEYEDESRASRRQGVVKVVIYEVLSLAFLIWVLSEAAMVYAVT